VSSINLTVYFIAYLYWRIKRMITQKNEFIFITYSLKKFKIQHSCDEKPRILIILISNNSNIKFTSNKITLQFILRNISLIS